MAAVAAAFAGLPGVVCLPHLRHCRRPDGARLAELATPRCSPRPRRQWAVNPCRQVLHAVPSTPPPPLAVPFRRRLAASADVKELASVRADQEASTDASSCGSGLTCCVQSLTSCDSDRSNPETGREAMVGAPAFVASSAYPDAASEASGSYCMLNALLASARPPPSEAGGTCCALVAELLCPSPPRTMVARPAPAPLQIGLDLHMAEVGLPGSATACSELQATQPLPESQPVSPGAGELEAALLEIKALGPRLTPCTRELLAGEMARLLPGTSYASSTTTPRTPAPPLSRDWLQCGSSPSLGVDGQGCSL